MIFMYISTTAAALSTLFFMMMGGGYVAWRIQVMLNPSLAPIGNGYIGTIIQLFLSHSQFIGEGLPISGYDKSTALQLLPEVNTDFLLTYLIYKLGWIVLIGIIMIFGSYSNKKMRRRFQ